MGDEWSFNFRTNPSYDHSDSDNDENLEPRKADDLNGIDLSAREETVSYKPNPFSIAKINAAYRANARPSGTEARSQAKHLGPPKAGLVKQQTTILDGFARQSSKTVQSNPDCALGSSKSNDTDNKRLASISAPCPTDCTLEASRPNLRPPTGAIAAQCLVQSTVDTSKILDEQSVPLIQYTDFVSMFKGCQTNAFRILFL